MLSAPALAKHDKKGESFTWRVEMDDIDPNDYIVNKAKDNKYIQVYYQYGDVYSDGDKIGDIELKVFHVFRMYEVDGGQYESDGRAVASFTIHSSETTLYEGKMSAKTHSWWHDLEPWQEIDGRFHGKGDGCHIKGILHHYGPTNEVTMIGTKY